MTVQKKDQIAPKNQREEAVKEAAEKQDPSEYTKWYKQLPDSSFREIGLGQYNQLKASNYAVRKSVDILKVKDKSTACYEYATDENNCDDSPSDAFNIGVEWATAAMVIHSIEYTIEGLKHLENEARKVSSFTIPEGHPIYMEALRGVFEYNRHLIYQQANNMNFETFTNWLKENSIEL